MPSKKKKTVKNSYYYFMISYRNDLIKRGVTPLPTMNELAAICDPIWKAMSPEERSAYDPKKQEEPEVKVTKYNSFGISFEDLERERKEKEDLFQAMVNEIIDCVNSLDKTSIKTQPFYLIHTNDYCITQGGDHVPAELAICEFTFKDGVTNYYHVLINPLRIPLGYMSCALKHSEDTHGLPMPGELEIAESNYNLIYASIVSFLKPNPFKKIGFKFPPLYTLNKNIVGVKDVLNKLFSSVYTHYTDEEAFRVFSLEKLFYALRNATASEGEEFPSEGIAQIELEKDIYSFAAGIACGFHEGGDNIPYCSLSYVKRWGYLMADFCCKNLKISLIPGVHCTLHADTNRASASGYGDNKMKNICPRCINNQITNHCICKDCVKCFKENNNRSMIDNKKKSICPRCINNQITNHSICKDCVKCFKENNNRSIIGKICGECATKITEEIFENVRLVNYRKLNKSCLYCPDDN